MVDTPFGDDVTDGCLELGRGVRIAEVAQHQRPGQDHRGRVRLVETGVLGRRAVDGLEDGGLGPDVGARRDAETADEPRAQVADDVAVEVRQDEDVVQRRLLDELHAHVVDDAIVELDPAVVLGGDRAAALEEEPVGQLHDVGLVDRRHSMAAVGDGVFEGEAGDPLGGGPGDDLDALGGVGPDHVLDARVEILGVLAHDDEVDVLVARVEADHRPSGPEVGVQVERLAERDVDAPEAAADRGRDRPLERDPVAPDRLEDVLRERCPVLGDRRLARLDGLPLEVDAGRVEDARRRLRQLRTDAVAGDQGDSVGHGAILAMRSGRRRPTTIGGSAAVKMRSGARDQCARPCHVGGVMAA